MSWRIFVTRFFHALPTFTINTCRRAACKCTVSNSTKKNNWPGSKTGEVPRISSCTNGCERRKNQLPLQRHELSWLHLPAQRLVSNARRRDLCVDDLRFPARKVVEVGSGFSTLIARSALQYAKLDSSLTVIDPSPRTDVEETADRVIYERVEDTKLDQFALTNRSLLFIDSSHITRLRGDVPYLYCEVLPQLPAGTVVHFHDIFIPYDYPTCYDNLCWTEQYVLQAMLGNTRRYHTLFATQYMTRHRTAEMQRTFGPQVVRITSFTARRTGFRFGRKCEWIVK